jgi:hypothetical protein
MKKSSNDALRPRDRAIRKRPNRINGRPVGAGPALTGAFVRGGSVSLFRYLTSGTPAGEPIISWLLNTAASSIQPGRAGGGWPLLFSLPQSVGPTNGFN